MMCSNSYRNHYIKVGQHPKCVVSSIERAGQPLVKQVVSSAEICSRTADGISSGIFIFPIYRKTLFSKTTMSGGKPYFIKKGKEKLYFSILSLLS